MEVKQTYETEVSFSEGLGIRAITIPARNFNIENFTTLDQVGERLGIRLLEEVELDWIQRAIATLLLAENQEDLEGWKSDRSYLLGKFTHGPEVYKFAEYVSMAAVFPFENSPLTAESIGSLLTKAGGCGAGTYIGFAVAGTTPLLFIAVPTGMIICGAAAGIAQGLEEGLRERISKFIRDK
ncbi:MULTISPECIES: hypothetical protein [unclassified Halomonas]|uniref:hypothetical protein n=1 Tax=unclassified Halomonas TaxID=2609666 RepID=UPI0005572CBF|nr:MULTISPECIES: hypothetical protein [unclassified Halomonas]CEP35285.1 Putative uncharacterized protein [Halomonas sp. R57-5]